MEEIRTKSEIKRKKILFVITKSNWGGAQRYVYDLTTALPAELFDVAVAYGGNGVLAGKLREKNIRGISIEKLQRDMNIFDDLKSFIALLRILKTEKPDIVHLNSSKIAGLGAVAARYYGIKKIIFTVHGFAFNEQRPWWQKILISIATYATVVCSTHVICISKKEYNQILHWPGVKSKASLIYNGITKPDFYTQQEARRMLAQHLHSDPNIFEGKTIIGTIAEITTNKGLEYAIAALAPTNCIYIIIGSGTTEEEEKLRQAVANHTVESKILLAGFIADAGRFLPAFDIFLLPSLKEGLPYVLIEAGYAAIPTITTHIGGIPEIIGTEQTGILIVPQNSTAITEAVTAMITHPDRARQYGKNLSTAVQEKFSLEKMVHDTITLYNI